MRFLARIKRLAIDFLGLRKAYDDVARQTVEAAARIWLEAALSEIPAWSGASRATFEQLASAVGEQVEIGVEPTAPNRIALGRANSRGGIERDGEGKWRFFYETSLEYLSANEQFAVQRGQFGVFSGLIKPTPYNFREKANAAVRGFSSDVQLPRVRIVEF